MSQEELRRAYTLLHRGEKKDAAQIVRDVIKKDKNNVNAWWMMSMLLEDEEKQSKALERVLTLQPDHKGAREKLRQIRPERQTAQIGQNIMATQEVMNLDWSKLKDDPHLDEQKAKTKEDEDAHKIATYGMLALGGFLVLVLVIVGGMTVRNMINSGPSPENAARAYLDALGNLDFDQVAALTCEEYRGDIANAEQELGFGDADLAGLTIDFSEITLDVIEQTDTTATVNVGGSFSFALSGVEMSFDIDDENMSDLIGDDTNVALVKENGEWLICEPTSGL